MEIIVRETTVDISKMINSTVKFPQEKENFLLINAMHALLLLLLVLLPEVELNGDSCLVLPCHNSY